MELITLSTPSNKNDNDTKSGMFSRIGQFSHKKYLILSKQNLILQKTTKEKLHYNINSAIKLMKNKTKSPAKVKR